MIVILAILSAGLRVEEIVAGNEFEDLYEMPRSVCPRLRRCGCARRRVVIAQLTMAAILHTSVLAPHFEPSITSGDRYCLVWISFVKWWFTQQALPKSAILTLITSRPKSSALRFSPVDDEEELEDLSREMPDTSFVRRSLETRKAGQYGQPQCAQCAVQFGYHFRSELTLSFPAASA